MNVYRLKISEEQTLELKNEGRQTVIKNEIRSLGSHQVGQSSFTTGEFTSPPRYANTGECIILVITTSSGESHVRVRKGEVKTGMFDFDRSTIRDFPV